MLTILLLSLNVVLLQGIPVGQEKGRSTRSDDLVDEGDRFNKCALPERLDPFSKWKTLFPLESIKNL